LGANREKEGAGSCPLHASSFSLYGSCASLFLAKPYLPSPELVLFEILDLIRPPGTFPFIQPYQFRGSFSLSFSPSSRRCPRHGGGKIGTARLLSFAARLPPLPPSQGCLPPVVILFFGLGKFSEGLHYRPDTLLPDVCLGEGRGQERALCPFSTR